MSPNYKHIGQRIKEIRSLQRMSQAELAEQIDMSVSYISHIETAKKRASLTALVRIANVLGVTVDALLNGNQINDPMQYHSELITLLDDCDNYEKKMIFDSAASTRKSLKDNDWLRRRK